MKNNSINVNEVRLNVRKANLQVRPTIVIGQKKGRGAYNRKSFKIALD